MENEFENKVNNAIEKFEGRDIKITISGIIESKYYMKKINYKIEEGILEIEDSDGIFFNVDIDDIENLYSEFTSDGYALLVLQVGRSLQIEIQTTNDRAVSIKEKIWKILLDSIINDENCKEACGA